MANITGLPTGPVFDKTQPFDTAAGVRLPYTVAPNMQFRIHGQNLLNSDGSAPNVLIGGRAMQVDPSSASSTLLTVTTPPDLGPANVEMQVVVRRTDAASVPETVVVAPSWPVQAMAGASENEVILTGLGVASRETILADGARVVRVEQIGPALWRFVLDQKAGSVKFHAVGHAARP